MILKATHLCCFLILLFATQKVGAQSRNEIDLADPTIFYYGNTYYLYGTNGADSDNGFIAYTSKDKINWKNGGQVLRKGDAFGTKGFWAPQVFKYQNKFYMAYVADERIAIAESDNPLGPFTQENKQPLASPTKIIDPFVFFDNGKIYLYHVRLENGNRMFMAELSKDLKTIKENTTIECLHATDSWENTAKSDWGVTEGPTVLKRKNKYYLFYSANDFRNPDYAVGYATSNKATGPWQKFSGNPILSNKETGINGSGHGDFFIDGRGKLNYVFHTHQSNKQVGPRRTAIINVDYKDLKNKESKFEILPKTFRFLEEEK